MDEALLSLLEKKDFEYITIKEICENAGVNRSTFYLHYENTSDLLEEALEYVNARFLGYFETNTDATIEKIKSGARKELIFITPEYLYPYLEFIRDHRRLFSAALARPKSFRSHAAFRKMATHLLYPIMDRFGYSAKERDYVLFFYIEGMMGIVAEWLRKDCRDSTEKIAEIIMKCVYADKSCR